MRTRHPIFKQLACAMMGLAFFLVAGGPLGLLQVVAWTQMVHDFSRTGSLAEAVGKTLDGRHLCPLCQKIAKARAAENGASDKSPSTVKVEKKAEVFVAQSKVEIPQPACRAFVHGAYGFELIPERFDAPPVPVPRGLAS